MNREQERILTDEQVCALVRSQGYMPEAMINAIAQNAARLVAEQSAERIAELESRLSAAQAELALAKVDAERWRWLWENHKVTWTDGTREHTFYLIANHDTLDAAIDRARAQAGEQT